MKNKTKNKLSINARVSVYEPVIGMFMMPEFLKKQEGTIVGTKDCEAGSGDTYYVIKFDNIETATDYDPASGVRSDKKDLVCFPEEVITVIESGSGGVVENV